ncbi:hypothetical protein D3C87_848210 [compost metagenome]
MTRFAIPVAILATALLPLAPAWAATEGGLYYQPIPGSSGNIQAVVPGGVLQIDYAPSLQGMQILQGALRLPAPLFEEPFSLHGLIGYRQIWGFGGGSPDTNGGVEVGLSASLPLENVAGYGSPLAPFGLYAFGLYNQLIMANYQWQFSMAGTALPSYGLGVTYELPTRAVVSLGFESFSLPQGIGGIASGANTYSGLIIGYRW